MATFIEELWTKPFNPGPNSSTEGFYVPGEIYHIVPYNQRTKLTFTTPPGLASAKLFTFLSLLPKMGFQLVKMEDWIEVSPVNAQFYQLTLQQKQQLEAQIKQGLAGIATSVSDFELLFHDLRKYKDFMEYFEALEKGKEEKNKGLVSKAEQSLKAVFIDQVDVHTDLPNTPIALRTIVQRWPTIIADFMQLEDSDTDPKKIAEKLKVSEAEGVVLATKNKLYQKWRNLFHETVLGRYERIKSLVEMRKKSIDEYKNMIRPYIARYRSIRELGETVEGRLLLEKHPLRMSGQAVSLHITTHWAYRAFSGPPELHKASIESERAVSKPILSMNFPMGLKEMIRENMDEIKAEGLSKIQLMPSGIESLDKWVWFLIRELEKHYNINLSIIDILKTRQKFAETAEERNWRQPYYLSVELKVTRTLFKLANGAEIEDMELTKMFPYFDSQNIILLKLLEMRAKELDLENYISQMIGESSAEGNFIKKILEEEYPYVFHAKKREKKKTEFPRASKTFVSEALKYFVKPGPYEPVWDDRVATMWMGEVADAFTKPATAFWKGVFSIPGFEYPPQV